jgi:hypothetical protein
MKDEANPASGCTVEDHVLLTPRYSGRNSHRFWKCVNALSGLERDIAYSMGCALQNHEHAVLKFINKQQNASLTLSGKEKSNHE